MTALRTESAWANQSPSPPSYLPVPGTKLTDDLNFIERTFNLASYLRALYIHHHIILPRVDAVFQALHDFVESATDDEGFVLITTGFTAQWNKAPQQILVRM
ncbi:hypothetical protein COOONC_26316 [Cooperia oncophora]